MLNRLKSLIKKATNNKLLSYVLWVIVSRILPIIIIINEFDLVSPDISPVYRWSFAGFFVVFWGGIRFWSDFKDFARDLKEGFPREIFLAITAVGPYLLLYFIGVLATNLTDDFMFIAGTLFWTSLVGSVFRANHMRLRRKLLQERGYVNVLR